jgi:hypothetical protein
MSAMPPLGEALARSLVDSLGSDCAAAAGLARIIVARQNGVIDSRSVGIGPTAVVARVTLDFTKRGWLAPEAVGWRIGPATMPQSVPAFLEGAASMRVNLNDEAKALAIVTLPLAPSAIERALPLTGFAHASLLSTDEALKRISAAAIGSMTVMTPFLNEDGLAVVLGLFQETRAPVRRLIVRQLGGAKDIVIGESAAISALGIEVLDYTLPAGDGFETFHAKVALADQDLVYVGSANMTVFARHSLDLGILADGRAAKVIASVVRAIERVATPVVFT